MDDNNLKKFKISQSNLLVESSYHLNLDEKRLVMAAIAKVQPGDDMPSRVDVSAQYFANLFGININSAYEQLKRAKDSLYERDVRIKNADIDDRIRWVHRVTYKPKGGLLSVYFTPEIAMHISNLSNRFTQYTIENVAQLKSIYAIRIYELLLRFNDFNYRWITIDDLREMFQIQEKYKRYADLRKYILKPAIYEINLKTNLIVSFNPEKENRRITKLHFTFKEKTQKEFDFQTEDEPILA